MIGLSRYQIVALCAALIFAAGVVRAVLLFFRPTAAEDLVDFALNPTAGIPLALPRELSFPEIPALSRRDPFQAQTAWRSPSPAAMPPPPLTWLLPLVPTPLAFRSDGTPRLAEVPAVQQRRADAAVLAPLRRIFREGSQQ